MSQRKTVTCPNPDVLAQAVAVRVLTTIRNLLAEPGRSRVDIALTGGTDGNRVLRAIGTDPLADDLDASRVHIWWGDERFVPEDSDDRNAKQARRFLNFLVDSNNYFFGAIFNLADAYISIAVIYLLLFQYKFLSK